MNDSDFTILTDEQLVALIEAAVAEAVRRGVEMEDRAHRAVLSAQERAVIAQKAAAREAERLRETEAHRVAEAAAEKVRAEALAQAAEEKAAEEARLWAKKKALSRMVRDTLGFGWTLTVWSQSGEKRVYLDGSSGGRVEYYETGNSRNAPQSLKAVWGKQGVEKSLVPELRIIVALAASEWTTLKIECDPSARAAVADLPLPDDYVKAREARIAAEDAARREAERIAAEEAEAARLKMERERAEDEAAWGGRLLAAKRAKDQPVGLVMKFGGEKPFRFARLAWDGSAWRLGEILADDLTCKEAERHPLALEMDIVRNSGWGFRPDILPRRLVGTLTNYLGTPKEEGK